MTAKEILTAASPNAHLLRQPAKTVHKQADVSGLIQDLRDTLRAHRGLGLAAPQIGVPLRVAVVEYGGISLALVNPEITVYRDERGTEQRGETIRALVDREGCLSFPDEVQHVPRPGSITVTYRTARHVKIRNTFAGMLARIICHEIDHLKGITFRERAVAMNQLAQRGGVEKPLTVDDLLPAVRVA